MWTSLASTLITALVSIGAPGVGGWVAPLASGFATVLEAFQRPEDRFAPGHRGVDLAAAPGTEVLAIGAGVVTHVGDVAGTPSVTIDHHAVRSSYLPVDAWVTPGQSVSPGEVIGVIAQRGAHCPADCLHLGLRRPAWEALDAKQDPYLDPIAWITRIPVLKPLP